jgi:hypothetical protein
MPALRSSHGPPRPAALVALLVLGRAATVAAQSAAASPPAPIDASALAKQSQNPISNLISIPLQSNFYTGGDLEDRTFYNLNVQPVFPFSVSKDWMVVGRMIAPFDSIPAAGEARDTGLGDIQLEFFLTPARPGKLIWGFGPIFSLPTATASSLETGSWAAGPAFVVVKNVGPFVLGGLVTQSWHFADSGGEPKTNAFALQPAINFNFGKGWALSCSPTITANWDADEGNSWTVPLGLGITRTTVFNRRPINVGLSYYHNVERPKGVGASQLRIAITLLYPK